MMYMTINNIEILGNIEVKYDIEVYDKIAVYDRETLDSFSRTDEI